jgi:hypothetical protein
MHRVEPISENKNPSPSLYDSIISLYARLMNSECGREKVCLFENPWNIQRDQELIKSIETYDKKSSPKIFNSPTVQQEY